MRLDKFLKVSRLIKRRTVAKEVCDGGRVAIDGRPAKAGSEVAVGNKITISMGSRRLKVEILAIMETVRGDQYKEMYQVLEDEKKTPEI